MTSIIYIQDAKKQLNYKDRRSFIKWCDKNGVGVLSDIGSRKQYVIEEEFEAAKSKPALQYIKQKYGIDQLSDVFNACLNFNTEYQMAFEQKQKKNFQKENYLPKGDHEKSFLARLTQKLTEL